jgi:hypothetical protein
LVLVGPPPPPPLDGSGLLPASCAWINAKNDDLASFWHASPNNERNPRFFF